MTFSKQEWRRTSACGKGSVDKKGTAEDKITKIMYNDENIVMYIISNVMVVRQCFEDLIVGCQVQVVW